MRAAGVARHGLRQLMERAQPYRRDAARGTGGTDGAIRLLVMPTIAEAALADEGPELREALLQLRAFEGAKSKAAYPRGIDEPTA